MSVSISLKPPGSAVVDVDVLLQYRGDSVASTESFTLCKAYKTNGNLTGKRCHWDWTMVGKLDYHSREEIRDSRAIFILASDCKQPKKTLLNWPLSTSCR